MNQPFQVDDGITSSKDTSPSRTQQKDREMKCFPDDVSTDHGKVKPCRGSVRARMLHLRAMSFFWLAVMTTSWWTLNALAVETQSGNDHWINTWTAGPMPPWAGPIPAGFFDQTVRQVVRISLGGERVRVRLLTSLASNLSKWVQPM